MGKTFISIGECMAELQATDDGLFRLGFAGDTLNTAWYMRALTRAGDVAVDYVTAVGTDPLSAKMLAFLKANGVGTRFIKEISDRTVGLYLITLTGAERSFTYWRSSSAARLLAEDRDVLAASLSQADAIYFSGITLAILSPAHRKNHLAVLQEMKSRGATIAFDSNARRRLWPSDRAMKAAMIAGYKACTLALPTFSDDQALFGDATPADCAKRIAGYGVKEIVVKDGGNACMVSVDTNLFSVAPEAVQDIVDTTGAGDSFNAGYIAARMSHREPVEAAKLGHRVAGRVIGERGALLAMASFSDLVVA
ncbi:MAG: sugar kinase [Aestuariivirga sp.]|nr:sugar kinase [Aestuariivirga sp.]